jgi:DDE superfamily endonuclease/Tc5 transposase DNA-binding domain
VESRLKCGELSGEDGYHRSSFCDAGQGKWTPLVLSHLGSEPLGFPHLSTCQHLCHHHVVSKMPDNESTLQLAITAYSRREFTSIRATAAAFKVSRSTLQRRIDGTSTPRTAHESQQLLSKTQEDLVVQWVLDCERVGYSITHAQLGQFARLLASSTGGPPSIGHNWTHRFIQRHPNLRTKIGKKIDHLRFDNTAPALLQDWFNRLQIVLRENKIKPENIYNVDETGIALGVCHSSTIIGSTQTSVSLLKRAENREWVTIIETISATGRKLRPVVIFKGKLVQTSWFSLKNVPDWLYTTSTNGWTSNEIGMRWLQDVFIPETTCGLQKRLLLLDGHGSHQTVEFMKKCDDNGIICFYLIPHSSHVLQPLDLACFSLVKSAYRKQVAELAQIDDAAPIKKIRFIQYYEKARTRGLASIQILAGWRASGIHPWHPQKVLNSHLVRHGTRQPQEQIPTPTCPLNSNITTPKNSQEFNQQFRALQNDDSSSRTVRRLFQKTGKMIQTLEFQSVQQKRQLEQNKTLIDEYLVKRRKKTAIDSNDTFTNIQQIVAQQQVIQEQDTMYQRQNTLAQAREMANSMIDRQMKPYLIEFHACEAPATT